MSTPKHVLDLPHVHRQARAIAYKESRSPAPAVLDTPLHLPPPLALPDHNGISRDPFPSEALCCRGRRRLLLAAPPRQVAVPCGKYAAFLSSAVCQLAFCVLPFVSAAPAQLVQLSLRLSLLSASGIELAKGMHRSLSSAEIHPPLPGRAASFAETTADGQQSPGALPERRADTAVAIPQEHLCPEAPPYGWTLRGRAVVVLEQQHQPCWETIPALLQLHSADLNPLYRLSRTHRPMSPPRKCAMRSTSSPIPSPTPLRRRSVAIDHCPSSTPAYRPKYSDYTRWGPWPTVMRSS